MSAAEVATDIVMRARDQTKGAFDSLEKSTTRTEKAFSAGRAAMGAMAGLASGALVGALSSAAQAAADDEANTLKLQTAIENSGASWDALLPRVDAAIAKGQELAFSDDETRNSIAEMTESTGSAEEAFKRLPLAMDLARAKHIPLETAARLLGKVNDENTKGLKRLGISLGEGADATEVLGAVQEKFGGQAERYGTTTSAAIARIKDRIGEWTEGIGTSLGPSAQYIALLPQMQSGFSLITSTLGGALGGFSKYLGFLNPITLATKAWSIAQAALNLVMTANPIGLVVVALAALAVGLKFAYDNSADFRNIVNQLFDWLGNLLKPLGWVWDRVMDLAKAFGLVGDSAGAMKDDASSDFAALQANASSSMASTKTAVVGHAAEMKQGVVSILDEMAAKGVGASEDMKVKSIAAAMGLKDSVVKQMEDMASGLGGWSAYARDQAIFDMQYAELETTLHAKGLSDGVIAEIMRMAKEGKKQMDDAAAASATAFAKMHDNMDGFNGRVSTGILNLQLFKQNFEAIPTHKDVYLDYHERRDAAAARSSGTGVALGEYGTPEFSSGGVMPWDGPAMLHRNEHIFTPEQMEDLSRPISISISIGSVDSTARARQVGEDIVQRMRLLGAGV
jgi:hypothetical protein